MQGLLPNKVLCTCKRNCALSHGDLGCRSTTAANSHAGVEGVRPTRRSPAPGACRPQRGVTMARRHRDRCRAARATPGEAGGAGVSPPHRPLRHPRRAAYQPVAPASRCPAAARCAQRRRRRRRRRAADGRGQARAPVGGCGEAAGESRGELRLGRPQTGGWSVWSLPN